MVMVRVREIGWEGYVGAGTYVEMMTGWVHSDATHVLRRYSILNARFNNFIQDKI